MDYTISNHRHFKDFTILPNTILQSQELTFAEKGLLGYLLSLPSDWDIKVSYIAHNFGETERTILRLLKGLIEQGYCKRVPKKGEDGRLAGQFYIITDIANDFSAPQKIEGAAQDAPHTNSRPTDSPAPREIEGAYNKENTLFNKEDIEDNKVESKPRGTSDVRECLFVNSRFYDFEAFKAAFAKDPKYAGADIEFYYERIKNWSAANGKKKKKDWISFTRNWMLSDYQEGKLKKAPAPFGSSLSQEDLEELKNYANL